MDFQSAFTQLNWLAVIVAALSTFVLGFVWYSLLFGSIWMKASGMTEEKAKQGNMAKTFGGAFLLSFVAALNLGMFLGPQSDMMFGIAAGAATGIGWVAPAIGVVYLFEQRSLALWLVNAGYWSVSFIVMGAILGAWH